MAGQGAPKNNDYAEKEGRGKTISLYLPAEALATIKKQLGDDASEAMCIKKAKEYALDGIEDRTGQAPHFDQLRFMVSNWQALTNHAEVFAPQLLQNDQWIAMKTDLERRTDDLGVTDFIRQIAERYRQQIEDAEEDGED